VKFLRKTFLGHPNVESNVTNFEVEIDNALLG